MTKHFEVYHTINGVEWFIEGMAGCRWEDESFDHEFGTEKRGYWVVEDSEVSSVGTIDEDGGDHEKDWKTLDKSVKDELMLEIMRLEIEA